MALEPELVEMMHDVLRIEPVVTNSAGVAVKDKFTRVTYGAALDARCYMVRMNKIARSREGEEVTSTLQAIMADPSLVVSSDDRLTWSDGSHPAIIEIRSAKNELGEDYYLEILA